MDKKKGKKKTDSVDKNENSTSEEAGPSRRVRKRRALSVKNYDDEDDDFVDEKKKSKETKRQTKNNSKGSAKKPDKKDDKKSSSENKNSSNKPFKDKEQKSKDSKLSTTVRTHFHRPNPYKSNNNILQTLNSYSSGMVKTHVYYESAVKPVIENVSGFKVSQLVTPFDRRVTSLAWHPHYPHLAVAGSKGGDIILWDSNSSKKDTDSSSSQRSLFKSMIEGRGPGGSIQSLKFDIHSPHKIYTASIDGTVTRHDFNGLDNKIYLETNDWERWYVGMDVSFSGRMMVAGNNKGMVTLLSLEGEKIWDLRLHKSKCNFVQFSEREPWMMVTTSTGAGAGSVKVWDIRNIKGPDSCITELHHNKAVNCAYFSSVTGDKLLTTDQHSELRVYQAPNFHLLRTIPHPHRQFQHLTPIKACWHPLADVLYAGRYPDPNFPDYHPGEIRSIDFFCPQSGDTLHQLHQPGLSQIISLSQFNPAGDKMLSGMGQTVMIWETPSRSSKEDTEDQVETVSATINSNLEGVQVQQWPDFTVKKKAAAKKKKKTTED